MCIVGAIIGAAVIGAAGSAVAGSKAAGATQSAANTAAQEQQTALTQQEQLAAPYTGLGTSAIPQLQTLLGLTGGGTSDKPNTSAAEAALAATPGYQFTLNQGLQGVENSAAAKGMLNSGNTLAALDQYGSGLADQTYQQAVGNLENTVGIGQAAAAGQAANIGNAATNMGNIAVSQGNTLAGIDANTIAGIENAAGGAANNYVLANTLANMGAGGAGGYPGIPGVQPALNSYNASLGYNTG